MPEEQRILERLLHERAGEMRIEPDSERRQRLDALDQHAHPPSVERERQSLADDALVCLRQHRQYARRLDLPAAGQDRFLEWHVGRNLAYPRDFHGWPPAGAANGTRRGTRICPVTWNTSSPFWLNPSPSVTSSPRSGLFLKSVSAAMLCR